MKVYPTAAIRYALGACGLAIVLSACGAEQPQSTVSRDLVSGVTSNNGGGMVPANFGSVSAANVSDRTFDTGNMAYPEPLAQGNLNTTRTR